MPNSGSFKKGYDPRRRLLTQEDRAKGYANAPSRIKARIRGLYKGGKIVKKGHTIYPELAI